MATKQQFSSFADLLTGSDLPVLVDFYAEWCGPCRLMAQTFAQIAPQVKGRVKLVKINTEAYPQLAAQYQVQALPTLVVFRDGAVMARVEGALSGDQILQWLQTQGL
ncbi:thioredoxin [Prochlorothrix hollandica]|uniref:Thioredoxin n=1 Tax=Prochlorothrix hollandica PCC 9006 = CALU 1027 TaxID=317619 RepID=A0A0M2PW87_PROHO|nr:thioredoxin [Prochlorothrix hollandica]KKJ00440.1 thioredoxin [Prochlorothrix hollandica PCC 9006 = CALU 1027]